MDYAAISQVSKKYEDEARINKMIFSITRNTEKRFQKESKC